jgi:hypothetical protein
MKKFTMTLVAGAAAFLATASAFAYDNNATYNYQFQLNNVYANMHLYGRWISGDLRATSVAIGNNADVKYAGSANFGNDQLTMGDVGATLNAHIKATGGGASFTVAGICNNASFSAEQAGATNTWSRQRCNTIDPFAIGNIGVGFAGGDVDVRVVAMGNNLTNDTVAATSYVQNLQINASQVYAEANVALGDVLGGATVTAAAIGNNLSVNHGFE